jgi:Transposase DDE domain group 1
LTCLAYESLTWTQPLARPDQPVQTWEPKRLRLRLLAVAARLITTGRRRILRLSKRWPWADLITSGHQQLAALA